MTTYKHTTRNGSSSYVIAKSLSSAEYFFADPDCFEVDKISSRQARKVKRYSSRFLD